MPADHKGEGDEDLARSVAKAIDEVTRSIESFAFNKEKGREYRFFLIEGSDKKTLVVTPVAPLAPGSYQVQWHALSVDTHKSKGSYGFKIGE